jgi:uncharacterized protein YjbI with pentapeptide repeats
VGARLAHALNVESGNFRDGRAAFARSLGCNEAQLVLLLRQAGAGRDPFNGLEWPNSPEEVWANLMEIEEFPRTQGANLTRVGLTGANLGNTSLRGARMRAVRLSGADLRGADLREAYVRFASLRGADLRGADLQDADARSASLRGANLRNADLREADLRFTDLREADLRWADLRGADLRWANLRHASLADARLEGAVLKHARLGHTELDPHPDGGRVRTFLRKAALAADWTTRRSGATQPTGAGEQQKPE